MPRFIITAMALVILALGYLLVTDVHRGGAEEANKGEATDARPTIANRPNRTPYLVRTLIDPQVHLDEQIEAIRNLPNDVAAEEFDGLIALLYQSAPETLSPNLWHTLQNEIMEVLRNRRFDFPQYAPTMAALLADKGADPVMRDYAAQHLSLYLIDRDETLPQEIIESSISSLLEALKGERERSHQIAGTTLMALCEIHAQKPHILQDVRGTLEPIIVELIDLSLPITLSNRIAAIQAAGRMKITAAHSTIQALAADESANSSYRLNAVAALGYYADPTDRQTLESLAQSNTRLRFAAQAALKNFNQQ